MYCRITVLVSCHIAVQGQSTGGSASSRREYGPRLKCVKSEIHVGVACGYKQAWTLVYMDPGGIQAGLDPGVYGSRQDPDRIQASQPRCCLAHDTACASHPWYGLRLTRGTACASPMVRPAPHPWYGLCLTASCSLLRSSWFRLAHAPPGRPSNASKCRLSIKS